MWALGVLLHFMVSGKIPFDDKNDFQVRLNIKNNKRKVSLPKKLSRECRRFINGLLDPDAKSRIVMATAINHPWFTKEGKGQSRKETRTEYTDTENR